MEKNDSDKRINTLTYNFPQKLQHLLLPIDRTTRLKTTKDTEELNYRTIFLNPIGLRFKNPQQNIMKFKSINVYKEL